MKTQIAWNWRMGRTELVVTSQKRENIVIAEAELLSNPPVDSLMPVEFEYAYAQTKRAVVRYNIMGKKKLSKLLRSKTVSPQAYVRLLSGLEEAVSACFESRLLIDKMLFDPAHVFIDEHMAPTFVYIPFSGIRYDAHLNSPLAMLEAMSEPRHMAKRMQTSQEERQREALYAYVMETKVFSINTFKRFLESECFSGIDVEDDNRLSETPSRATGDKPIFVDELFSAAADGLETKCLLRRQDRNESFALPLNSEVIVGRASTCDIVIEGNPYMGRRHLSIWTNAEYAIITDLESANGTYACNKRLIPGTPVKLSLGDRFLIGGEEFCIVEARAESGKLAMIP